MQLRVRGPQGQATLKVEPGTSVAAFRAMLAEATGVPADRQELKSGFPPRPLALPTDGTLADAGIQSGDSLTVTAGAPTAATVPAPAAAAAGAAAAPAAAGAGADHHLASVAHLTEDEQLARAIALSMGEAVPDLPPAPAAAPPAAAAPAPAAAVRAPAAAAAPPRRAASPVRAHPAGASSGGGVAAPTSVPLPGGGAVVRRVVDSDNSCLFNSVGYATERSRAKAAQLRQVVADAVLADPLQWSEAVLGKPPAEYCRWIKDPQRWGGAIELAILSAHLGKEIAAFDIQTTRVDVYGQGAGYDERLMVIYDGLHYDALAVAAYEGAAEALDTTVIPCSGPRCDAVMEGARQLAAAARAARAFTDTASFTLRCGVCQLGLRGEKEAVEHAKATGHTNFSEY